MVVKIGIIVVGLALLAGTAFGFQDTIRNLTGTKKSAEELARQRKIDERGALTNLGAFIFGEPKPKSELLPEQVQAFRRQQQSQQNKFSARRRAQFKSDPSNTPPNLASFPRTEQDFRASLNIPFNKQTVERPQGFLQSLFTPTDTSSKQKIQSSEILTKQQSENRKRNVSRRKARFPVRKTLPTSNVDNIVPKTVRVSQGKTKNQITKPTAKSVPQIGLIPTAPTSRASNVVPKSVRLSKSITRGKPSSTFSQGIIEKKELKLQIG